MLQTIKDFYMTTGFDNMTAGQFAMIIVSFVLLYLAIKRGFEPLLLIPIAFGMFLTNLPAAGLMASPEYATDGSMLQPGGLLYYIYQGNKLGIFPPLIFLGVGHATGRMSSIKIKIIRINNLIAFEIRKRKLIKEKGKGNPLL